MIIFLSIFCSILFCCLVVVSTLLYMMSRSALTLQEQVKDYEEFINKINMVLENDIDFLRAVIAKNFSTNIPEVQQLSAGLSGLRNDITRIKSAIQESQSKKK